MARVIGVDLDNRGAGGRLMGAQVGLARLIYVETLATVGRNERTTSPAGWAEHC